MPQTQPSISINLAGPEAKRYATRYEPMRRDACLTWWNSNPNTEDSPAPEASMDLENHRGEATLMQFALLLDISHTGASVALDRTPHPGEDVWLRFEGGNSIDWTQAEVVGVTNTPRGPHLVRLAFRCPCPFETLRAVVCG